MEEVTKRLFVVWFKFLEELYQQMKDTQWTGSTNKIILKKIEDSLNVTYNLLLLHLKKNMQRWDLVVVEKQKLTAQEGLKILENFDSKKNLDDLINTREALDMAIKLKLSHEYPARILNFRNKEKENTQLKVA